MLKAESDGKFGTFQGVLVPNILQMIGVILFLRLGWVLGHAGIVQMSAIITMSALILIITALSLSSIVSNMRMEAGGAYYLISRALGIEFGSAIGILSCISQMCSIALCVTGFAESVYEFFPQVSLDIVKGATLVSLLLISYFSTNFAMKTQIFIFVALGISVGAVFLGSKGEVIVDPPLVEAPLLSFWTCFSMFFPAMTGIECGMAMSGDLKNPSRSLVLGTFGALLIVYSIYMSVSYFLSTFISPEVLRAYPFVIYYASNVGFLIIMGVWAATLSSALGAILGGPRVMQAVAKDGILPKFLAKGHGETNQPRIATMLVFLLSLALTLGMNIDQIIPILTMACLVTYGLINFIAFFEALMKNPSYRPTIRTHWAVSLFGSVSCLVAMFLINPGAAFIVIALVSLFCVWTSKRKIQGNWDDLKHSIFSFFVHRGTIKLSSLEVTAKSWRPHILTIFEKPVVQRNLAFFSHALNQGKGFLTFGTNVMSEKEAETSYLSLKEDLNGFKIPSHLHLNVCANPYIGMDQIIRNYGFGLLRPNTVILTVPEPDQIDTTIRLLIDAHNQHKNVVLLKDDLFKDYLFADPTRKDKQINLWWRGRYPGNFELCLAFAYLLQQSKLWPRAKICIKMITKDEETQKKLVSQFNQHRPELRINHLEFSPQIDSEDGFFPNFEENSNGADLTFLGLKKPEENVLMENYRDYFLDLLKNTENVHNIAFVLCGEKIKFRNIFRD